MFDIHDRPLLYLSVSKYTCVIKNNNKKSYITVVFHAIEYNKRDEHILYICGVLFSPNSIQLKKKTRVAEGYDDIMMAINTYMISHNIIMGGFSNYFQNKICIVFCSQSL